MRLKSIVLIPIFSLLFCGLQSQNNNHSGITTIYIIDGKEVTEQYVLNLDPGKIKSMKNGVTDEEKSELVEKYGERINNSFISVITLFTDEELTGKSVLTEEELEQKKKQDAQKQLKHNLETTIVSQGQTAPDFTVTMIDGSKVVLSDLKGKVVLLNFWATWCPPCLKELHEIPASILVPFKGKDFVFLAISRGEKSDVVSNKLKQLAEKGIVFNSGLDPDRAIYSLYATEMIPRNFLIDQDGKIVYFSIGFEDNSLSDLVSKIEDLLDNN